MYSKPIWAVLNKMIEDNTASTKETFALIRRERQQRMNDPTRIFLDPERKVELLPPGEVAGQVLRRRRGEKTAFSWYVS